MMSDEAAGIMHDKQELISDHVMSEEKFNKTKAFSFLTNVLGEGVPIGFKTLESTGLYARMKL